ncbi:hypothetical protein B0H14DRAFT_2583613 [Mycena olivaceomarginata]|nr:hypothetical protein B0H14DRAFT_2583613 [Mycena olivaceomarginata]
MARKKGVLTASRATAPRVTLGGDSTAAPAPAAVDPASLPVSTVPSVLFSKPIRIKTKTGEIVGRGKLTPTMDDGGDGYCRICRDGGKIILCSVTQGCLHSVCLPCLENPTPDLLALPFCSPDCHSDRERTRRNTRKKSYKPKPYEGFLHRPDGKKIRFTNGTAVRSLTARASSESVLLLVFCLDGLPLETTPIPMLASFIECLFTGNCVYLPVFFKLDAAGIKALQYATKALSKELTTGELCSVRRILTLVVSHSTPEGDIHILPGNTGAAVADEVLNELLPKQPLAAFCANKRTIRDHLLVFLTCGALFTVPEAAAKINNWVVSARTSLSSLWYRAISWAVTQRWNTFQSQSEMDGLDPEYIGPPDYATSLVDIQEWPESLQEPRNLEELLSESESDSLELELK